MKYKIPVAQPDIGLEEIQNAVDVVKSGWVSSKGPYVETFEKDFSNYIGTRYGLATSNGTSALHLALTALGIGKKDKVLVASLNFVAVANAVTYTGAQPVFVDSHPEYWCVDPSKIGEKIESRTKAIIVVHLYGHPSDMGKIMQIAEQYGLLVIEDCAEAHGAEYNGKKVGTFGTVSCFSFYGNKIVTTGEGGMCLSDNEELIEKMKILRDHGMTPTRRYWHDIIGYNYRMTNLQAAIGVAQLKKIQYLIDQKRQIAMTYKKLLKDLPNVTLAPEMPWARSVYWLFSILVGQNLRDNLINQLEKEGIETRPFFYPIHILPPYDRGLSFPVAEKLSASGVNLPSGYHLSKDQIQQIAESLVAFLS